MKFDQPRNLEHLGALGLKLISARGEVEFFLRHAYALSLHVIAMSPSLFFFSVG